MDAARITPSAVRAAVQRRRARPTRRELSPRATAERVRLLRGSRPALATNPPTNEE
jgi:hypothetical protein